MAQPALRDPEDDAYPLSTYPMFIHRRGRVNDVTSALAISPDGSEARVPPSYVANAETMQAFYRLQRAVQAGRESQNELCRTIAERIRHASAPELSGAVRVELVTERVDAIDYLAGRARPSNRRVHARCPVPKGEAP
jgi:hypothetical protein